MKKLLSLALLIVAVSVPGCRKHPLSAAVPSGQTNGRTGVVLSFTSYATDPGGRNVSVRFDWGDGDTSDWSALVASGATVTDSHSWSAGNTYSVRAQAKNESEVLSDWSQGCDVRIVSAWTQTFGGTGSDEGFAVAPTADGGYIVAGQTFSFGSGAGDVYLVKTDGSGKELWSKTIGTTGYDAANAVIATPDGGCVFAGTIHYDAIQMSNAYLVKVDAAGNAVFAANFGGAGADMGRGLAQTSDGGYVMVGQTGSMGSGGYDVYLIKVDADGNTLWQQAIGGQYDDIGYSVQQTNDGGYIIAGETDLAGAGVSDISLIKTDSTGHQIWAKTFDYGGHDYAYSVENTLDGGFIVAGQVMQGTGGGRYAYLLKTDADGNKVWDKTYGTYGGEMARSVKKTGDGGYIAAGTVESQEGNSYDILLIRVDSNGDTLWTRTFGGPDAELGYSVQVASDSGYVISGTTESYGAGDRDVWLIKTDSQGKVEP